ncbi:MAG: GerMN domain-containing protein [Treponema sp.]|jgi:hypothetical protein|nr:GerMN domain-containing protein [Treponema sp.]
MKGINEEFPEEKARFSSRAWLFWLICLVILAAAACYEALSMDRVRQTFEFYELETGKSRVEERFFPRSAAPEEAVKRYVEEVLLGPVLPQSAPLFPKETRLRSLLVREGTVYADLSGEAVLSPLEGGRGVIGSLDALERGIRRNFPWVRKIKLFIEGNDASRRDRPGADQNRQISVKKNAKIRENPLTNNFYLI